MTKEEKATYIRNLLYAMPIYRQCDFCSHDVSECQSSKVEYTCADEIVKKMREVFADETHDIK